MADSIAAQADKARTYAGRIEQFLGVTSYEYSDGPARGARGYHLYNDAGLEIDVLGDRALDIGAARFKGRGLAWLAPAGFSAPGICDAHGRGWIRAFGGGLVTTCGLTNVGPPVGPVGADGAAGQHGRISFAPAEHVSYGTRRADSGAYEAFVEGDAHEACLFSENLRMRRSVRLAAGSGNICVDSTVTNEGARSSPLLFLLHCNFGWPLLSEHTVLTGPFADVTPRDADAESGAKDFGTFPQPIFGFPEHTFFVRTDPQTARPEVVLTNPAIGLRVNVQYNLAELPHLSIWKMVGVQEYVCGIEPGTCYPVGRDEAARRDQLIMIEPGECRKFDIVIAVSEENDTRT